jgi:hypothetical protein
MLEFGWQRIICQVAPSEGWQRQLTQNYWFFLMEHQDIVTHRIPR